MYEKFLEKIKEYDTIIIHRHSNPDGDAIGSQVGLKHLILSNFPEKKVYMVGDAAGRYAFMDDSVMDTVDDSKYEKALTFVLDSGSTNMVCDERYKTSAYSFRIDHHMYTGSFTDDEIIESSVESCAGIIAGIAKTLSLNVNEICARSLFTGMVTDSGRFRFDSVSSDTFLRAAFLMEKHKIDFNDLYSKMYAEDFASLRRKAEFTLKIKFTKNNVAYIYTDKEEVEKRIDEGMTAFGISRGMVGVMGDIKGVNIWVNFTESEGKVLAELRSNKFNINQIAVKYGGGGHEHASGATLANRDEAMAMLNDLDEMMQEYL